VSIVGRDELIQIAGAGPAGLAAAITLARAGRRVIVHEAQRELGYRFQNDLQGLENWTTERDVLDELREMALTTAFTQRACRVGIAFDAWGEAYPMRSDAPLFYMVERGPGPGSLDTALFEQAHALGVEVRFGSRLEGLEGPGILAVGPKAADAIAVGYHFEADMDDGFWVICDETLAPQGYAYLLVMNGHGTVKSCMFSGFKQENMYVERTVDAFRRCVGLEMRNARPHGGVGNFNIPVSAASGLHPIVGEQAGFQDMLWGFGMRLALRSGVLAAQSLVDGGDYEVRWRRELGPWLRASLVSRAFYGALGNRGYRWALRYQVGHDAREVMRRLYRPSPVKRLLIPWAHWRYRSRRRDTSCNHVDCACIWCRCTVPR
jgi:flavin-dependent dehydrogenase